MGLRGPHISFRIDMVPPSACDSANGAIGPSAVRACLLAASPSEAKGLRRLNSTPTGSTIERTARAADSDMEKSMLVGYRSVGLGIWGAVLRFVGMPLEKLALFMNSSQVSGSGQLAQAFRLTFAEGPLAPFKVVGRASMIAWFFQYSAMGLVFQAVDITLSSVLGTKRIEYGAQLMEPVDRDAPPRPAGELVRTVGKTACAPVLAGTIESCIANRAEAERYFGIDKFSKIKQSTNPVVRAVGPGFIANAARNAVMSSTSFVLTPLMYKNFYPQERKSQTTLFWFGLGMNIFVGNVVAINLQALWGRSLDQLAAQQHIDYRGVIRESLRKEGVSAFITPSKWFSRVLMNAPAQGTLPWFYNEVLPKGEAPVRRLAKRVESMTS